MKLNMPLMEIKRKLFWNIVNSCMGVTAECIESGECCISEDCGKVA
jgi:hypothetical protein